MRDFFVILHFEYLVMAPKGAEARAPDSRTGASALQRSSKLGNKLDEVTSSCKAPLTCDTEVNDVIDNVEENVNEVEENVVGHGNINYEALQNLSVDQALAFFSS